jgi:hypothetical protein
VGSEHGKRCVALKFVNQTIPFIDGIDHDLEESVEHLGDLFGRIVRGQMSRADQIDVEDCGFPDISG